MLPLEPYEQVLGDEKEVTGRSRMSDEYVGNRPVCRWLF
jgi:hypothetical protein